MYKPEIGMMSDTKKQFFVFSPIKLRIPHMYVISVKPVLCGDSCLCQYNMIHRTNMFNCSGPQHVTLPQTVPEFTNWITITDAHIGELCGSYNYLTNPASTVTHLNLQSSNIESICPKTLDGILKYSNIKSLNLAKNNLTQIPHTFNKLARNLKRLWIGGNPINCECDMLWLASWFNNTIVSDQRLVQDYQDVICTGGKLDGTPVYRLSSVAMGCYPKKADIWIIRCSITSGLLLLSVIVVVILHRKWNAVRWIVYKNFDKLLGDPDRNEKINETEFDAFLSYW